MTRKSSSTDWFPECISPWCVLPSHQQFWWFLWKTGGDTFRPKSSPTSHYNTEQDSPTNKNSSKMHIQFRFVVFRSKYNRLLYCECFSTSYCSTTQWMQNHTNNLIVQLYHTLDREHVDITIAKIAVGLLVNGQVEIIVFVLADLIHDRKNEFPRKSTNHTTRSYTTRWECFWSSRSFAYPFRWWRPQSSIHSKDRASRWILHALCSYWVDEDAEDCYECFSAGFEKNWNWDWN